MGTYIKIKPKQISKPNNTLTIKLFNQMNNNNVFSPLSIIFALSLLHLSAFGNTENELSNLFNYKYSINELQQIYTIFNNDIMNLANALIINNKYKINEQYLTSIKNLALIVHTDFNSTNSTNIIVNDVNEYIKTNTKNLIKDILKHDDINDNTISILINTIYFKAQWLHKFKANNTDKELFKPTNKMVDMMYQKEEFNYYENELLQLVELLYENNDYCMGFLLPKSTKNYDIPKFNMNELNKYIANLQYKKVKLYIPKFKHRKTIRLIPLLEQLGVHDIFTNKAQLNIAKNICVSNIIHEAVVIIDELGTEAAATTIVMMELMAMPPTKEDPIIFKADHPFIYYIRHRPSNMILFYGDYRNE